MELENIIPPITGNALTELLDSEKTVRDSIVDSLIYRNMSMMVSGDAGKGKSTITTQIAIEMSAGLPVLGHFHTPKPVKVLYCQCERHILETLERVKNFRNVLPVNSDNLLITTEFQKVNFVNQDDVNKMIMSVNRDCPDVDMIFIDPIYSIVEGDLSEGRIASAFIRSVSKILTNTNASIWMNHHVSRDIYYQGKKIDKDDPFYGSTWLKAHIQGGYYMKMSKQGIEMAKKKDTFGILIKRFETDYNKETGLSYVIGERITAKEKVIRYIRKKELTKEEFSFNDLLEETELSESSVRAFWLDSSFQCLIEVVSSYRNKNLYRSRDS